MYPRTPAETVFFLILGIATLVILAAALSGRI